MVWATARSVALAYGNLDKSVDFSSFFIWPYGAIGDHKCCYSMVGTGIGDAYARATTISTRKSREEVVLLAYTPSESVTVIFQQHLWSPIAHYGHMKKLEKSTDLSRLLYARATERAGAHTMAA